MKRSPEQGILELNWMGKEDALIPVADGKYDYAWVGSPGWNPQPMTETTPVRVRAGSPPVRLRLDSRALNPYRTEQPHYQPVKQAGARVYPLGYTIPVPADATNPTALGQALPASSQRPGTHTRAPARRYPAQPLHPAGTQTRVCSPMTACSRWSTD